ncbi:MAG: hypothetical protein QW667_07280 [Candidatus Bathyarchaeia archaeon]
MPRDFWEDFFRFRFGPWGICIGPHIPFKVDYRRTTKSHIIRLQINPEIKKEEIKVRLLEHGILEIELPRKIRGEEIPVE